MTPIFLLGLFGSIILVIGAWLPDKPVKHPVQSLKDWCFAIGALVMLVYSVINYINGAPIFFVFLEGLVTLSSAFMMLNIDDRIDTPIVIAATIGLIGWSISLAQGSDVIIFIVGLAGIAIGYVLKGGTVKRELALIIGSVLIALFSYLSATWIFFWLNVFFALFSAWEAWRIARERLR